MFVQAQVTDDQMVGLAPLLLDSGARILVDHAGRPVPSRGLDQPGFRAVLDLARSGRAVVKLSGHQKYSAGTWPYADAEPCVRALVDAYGLDACVWASDWPFLRAAERLDMGPLLRLVERWWPDPADRRRLLWDTPRRLFGFGEAS
jgi:predicted TIM-barrel fold metal-dependent hydrolase